MNRIMSLTFVVFLVYFLIIFGALVLFAYFVETVRQHFSSARAIWIAVCVAHLIAILAFDHYHPDIPGNLDEPRFAEQFQWLSILPMLLYCFPSSVFSFALGAALQNGVLCPIFGPQACDSELAFVAIWWLVPVTLGYLQWFKLLPRLLRKFERRFPTQVIS